MTRRRLILGLSVLAAVCFLYWFFQPYPASDADRVDNRLLDLATPYQSMETCWFSDGGSIGVGIVDRHGKRESFAMPAHLGDSNRYTRVFVGALHDGYPDAVEIADPEHTERMLISILEHMPDRTPDDADRLITRSCCSTDSGGTMKTEFCANKSRQSTAATRLAFAR
jgi:hypothetical protein